MIFVVLSMVLMSRGLRTFLIAIPIVFSSITQASQSPNSYPKRRDMIT